MGNRGVMTFVDENNTEYVSIYMHWNGGVESIKAFLDYAKEVDVRGSDPSYAAARVTQIAANFMGGTLSVGLGHSSQLDCDNGDNGQYIVRNLEIIEHKHRGSAEEFNQDYYDRVLTQVRAANTAAHDHIDRAHPTQEDK